MPDDSSLMASDCSPRSARQSPGRSADAASRLFPRIIAPLWRDLRPRESYSHFSLEIGTSSQSQMHEEEITYLADTVIRLTQTDRKRGLSRNLEIIKSRGHDFETGQHTLQITDGQGLRCFAACRLPGTASGATNVQCQAFCYRCGGAGYSDRRRHLRWVHYAGAGGVRGGQNRSGHASASGRSREARASGLLISLDEHPAQIVRNAATLGLDLQELVDAGALHILFENPQELNLDRHFAQIVRLVEKHNIQRMVIDGLTSYSTALDDQTRLSGLLSCPCEFQQRPADDDVLEL